MPAYNNCYHQVCFLWPNVRIQPQRHEQHTILSLHRPHSPQQQNKDLFPMLKYRSPATSSAIPFPDFLWSLITKLKNDSKTINAGPYQTKVIKQLGKGVEATTYLVEAKFNNPQNQQTLTFNFVIKKIKKPFALVKNIIRQPEGEFYLRHRDLIQNYSPMCYHVDKTSNTIILEVAQPFSLQDHAHFYPTIKQDLIYGLSMMHRDNIVHHDIKLANIAYVQNQGKWGFIDYGMATPPGRPGMGEPEYRSPGQLKHYMLGLLGHKDSAEISFKDDWRRLTLLLLQIYHKQSLEFILVKYGFLDFNLAGNHNLVRAAVEELLSRLPYSGDPEEVSLGKLLQMPNQATSEYTSPDI